MAEDRTGTFRRGFLKLRLAVTQNSPESCIVFSNPSDAVLDIVFVHGFGGDRLGTWTSGEVCWPRQLLKSRLERARIISFGYEANVSQLLPSESHSLNSISECASELITSLVKLRANVPLRERALIFVVHSLGSTVVKEALCHSSSAPHQNSRAISRACKGVIFLGAAHREIWEESFGQIARNAALAVQPSLEPEILSALSEGCAILKFDRINNAFLTFINAETNESFRAITFYEEVVENRKVVVKRESARMDSPRHHLRRLNADHNSMCRFVHADDPIYMEVSAVIREFYDSVLKPQQIDCEVLYDGPDAVLDVVFVHSLGYGHSKTWTHNGVFWPKALLPADLPHARIIAYHYQTDFDAFQQDDQTVLCDHASQFLLSLINVRENLPCHQPSRSILFIAHATGGILVKQLLNISHLTKGQASMHAISMATRGVIFFGTAHQNDGSRGVGKIAAQSVRAGFPKLTNAVAKAIERDPSFEHINVAFQDFLEKGEHPLHLVSFYEKGRLLPQPIVPRNSVTLSIQQHTAQIPGTHALLGRFDTDEKQQYVMKQIRFIAGDAATGQDSPVINDQPELQQPETESAATLMADAEVPASATESASQILQPHIGHDALDDSRQREEEQLDAPELERRTRHAYHLATKWQSSSCDPEKMIIFDATSATPLTDLRFLPGRDGKRLLTVSKGIWSVISLWDIGDGLRRIADWSPKGGQLYGFAVNTDPDSPAAFVVSIFDESSPSHSWQRIVILSLRYETGNSTSASFETLSTINTPYKPVSIAGDIIAFSDDTAETMIWNWRESTYAALRHLEDPGGTWQPDRCLQVLFVHKSILVVRARSIHLFPEPVLGSSEAPAPRYSPIARHSFGRIDGVSVSESIPEAEDDEARSHSRPLLSILVRSESDSLDLYILEPNPDFISPPASPILSPLSPWGADTDPDSDLENHSSLPITTPSPISISPYIFPPTQTLKVPSARGSLRCTDVILGRYGTAVWIHPQDRAITGLVSPNVHPQDVHPPPEMHETLMLAVFPGPLKLTGCGTPSTRHVQARSVWRNSFNNWTCIDYDEELGRIALGSTYGRVTILDL